MERLIIAENLFEFSTIVGKLSKTSRYGESGDGIYSIPFLLLVKLVFRFYNQSRWIPIPFSSQ